jgi:predicted negative regulator of RcsB-dependent stress response
VVDNSKRVELRQLARLRLASLASDRGDFAAALKLLTEGAPGTLVAAFEEARGDVKLAQGDTDAAREAYRAALAAPRISPSAKSRVQMKLDDLGSMSDESSGV